MLNVRHRRNLHDQKWLHSRLFVTPNIGFLTIVINTHLLTIKENHELSNVRLELCFFCLIGSQILFQGVGLIWLSCFVVGHVVNIGYFSDFLKQNQQYRL